MTNQIHDHVTHHGSASAGPSIPPSGGHDGESEISNGTASNDLHHRLCGIETRDTPTTPFYTVTSNGETVREHHPHADHTSSIGSISCIDANINATVDTGCFGHSSSTLSPGPVNPVLPVHYGESNTFQYESIENSQAPTFNSDNSSFLSTQIPQPTSIPNPFVGSAEDIEKTAEMWVQAQFSTDDELWNVLPTIHQTHMGRWDAVQTGINYAPPQIWDFYNPQQMTYPTMAFSHAPSPLGFPSQMYAPPRPRIYCAWPLCMESFARPGDLERHRQSVHLGIKHHCFWPGCHNNHGKGYARCDKLRTHQKEKHGFA